MISPELLRRYPYFTGLSEESLKQLAQIAEEQSVAAGERMFSEGDPVQFMYIIIEGEVDIQYQLGSGELRTVDTLVAGDILVWSALVEPFKCTTIGTVRKNVQLLAIDALKLRGLCDAEPLLGYRLLNQVTKLLAHRLQSARVQLASM